MTLIPLDDATPETSGNKASTLATLRRAGFDVPDGFVIPVSEYLRHHDLGAPGESVRQPNAKLVKAVESHLEELLGQDLDECVAVRSSATDEDGSESSAAGQHDTVLGVRGAHHVAEAVARCWASLHSNRATAYRGRLEASSPRADRPAMAVLVQRMVQADVSGVLFTGTPRLVEAVPGLGKSLVSGTVTPDGWTLDDSGIIARRPLAGSSLTDATVLAIDTLGQAISATLGYEADVEWALTDGKLFTLQARPITAALPAQASPGGHGLPASPGRATGPTCVLHGPWDFHRFSVGDIIVCRTTDPAWTPLFRHATGIVTETGGLLCHAAIVARELGIPAVLSVPHATTRFPSGRRITLDGGTGLITPHPR